MRRAPMASLAVPLLIVSCSRLASCTMGTEIFEIPRGFRGLVVVQLENPLCSRAEVAPHVYRIPISQDGCGCISDRLEEPIVFNRYVTSGDRRAQPQPIPARWFISQGVFTPVVRPADGDPVVGPPQKILSLCVGSMERCDRERSVDWSGWYGGRKCMGYRH